MPVGKITSQPSSQPLVGGAQGTLLIPATALATWTPKDSSPETGGLVLTFGADGRLILVETAS